MTAARREAAIVRRPLDLEHGIIHRLAAPRERFLELGLVVDMAVQRVVDPAGERLHDRLLDLLETVLEKERGEGGFEECREHVAVSRETAELVRWNVGPSFGQLLRRARAGATTTAQLARETTCERILASLPSEKSG